jgi:Tfp pilus assembly protein PilO
MTLSKREMVMLAIMIIIGVFFVEYRFVIVPGIDRYDALMEEKQSVQSQVDTIQLNLAIAKQNERKRDENLKEIETLSKRYFDELQMDALLVRTHDLVLEKGFDPSQYQLQPVQVSPLSPQTLGSFDMQYELKNLADTYRSLSDNEPDEPDTEEEVSAVTGDQVEQYQISLTATATYEQIQAFLEAITKLQKSVIVSSLSITPEPIEAEPTPTPEPDETEEPTEPTEPDETEPEPEQKLSIQMTVYYYGLVKLVPTPDDYNSWYREPFVPVEYNPFEPLPAPEETEVEEPEA